MVNCKEIKETIDSYNELIKKLGDFNKIDPNSFEQVQDRIRNLKIQRNQFQYQYDKLCNIKKNENTTLTWNKTHGD